MRPDGAAAKDGRLKKGDRILSVGLKTNCIDKPGETVVVDIMCLSYT